MSMKQLLCLIAFLVTTLAHAQQAPANDNPFNSVTFRSLPALKAGTTQQGVSAPYVGYANGALWVSGGCNFPNRPAAEGGTKKFYRDIYILSPYNQANAQWVKKGEFPDAVGYGVSVSVPDGVACVGGTDGYTSCSDGLVMRLNSQNEIEFEDLPSLPVALDNMSGYYADNYIYVAGGQTDGKPSNAVFRLPYPKGEEWERIPDFPGEARLQPAVAVQKTATGNSLYVLGGYAPATTSSRAKVHSDGWCYDLKRERWQRVAPMIPHGTRDTLALVGAQAVSSGCAHIVCIGGVNRQIFERALNLPTDIKLLEAELKRQPDSLKAERLKVLKAEQQAYLTHPEGWYRFQNELLIYHTITDTWVTESRSPLLARAGAGLIQAGNEWIVVNGETKPGIRSKDVTAVKMTMRPTFGWLNWSVLIAYLLAMVALGYYFMRREGDADDFFKGGGRIPWWAAGISIYATMLSAITYMAYPAKAYATDWTYYPMLVTILFVSFPVIKYYLPFFRRLNVTSAYEYLELRFNAPTRLMASALFIIFMVARMALVLYLPSLALTAVTGIDIYICIVLMAVVTTLYCTMGGVEAVVWGDVVQGIILVGGAIFSVIYLVNGTEGGVSGFLDIGMAADKFRLIDWSFDITTASFWVILLGGMANNLISYTSDQTVIQRYLTTKDERSAGHSILMNGVMSVCISIAFFAIGAGLYTFFKTHPTELDYTMTKSDTIFPFFIMSQMPQGVAGLLIAAIFAATMSTISSNINSVATAFSIDFYKRWRPATSSNEMLKVARRACLVSGLLGMGIALLMATWEILSLLDFFQEILGLLSSGLGGLFLMGIFFPRIGGKAALRGFIAGVAAVFLLRYLTPVSFLLYGFVGMAVSVLVGYICSFFYKDNRDLSGLTWERRIS